MFIKLKQPKTLNITQVKQIIAMCSEFGIHVNELNTLQKEMDKVLQSQKSTWDIDYDRRQAFKDIIEPYCKNGNYSNSINCNIKRNSISNSIKDETISVINNSNTSGCDHHNLITSGCNIPLPQGFSDDIIINNQKIQIQNQSDDNKLTERYLHKVNVESQGTKTTATILVSKTKTKTGLPLLMKKI